MEKPGTVRQVGMEALKRNARDLSVSQAMEDGVRYCVRGDTEV